MALKTVDFKGVEIFAVGTWNGNAFTSKDLDNVVTAYAATKDSFNIPVKLGHNDKQKLLDDAPAAGWVENVRKVGSKLVADLRAVPATVGDLITSGAFRKRSVELNVDFKVAGKTYPLMLTGMALLGSTLPGVDGLADIVALYEREEIDREDDSTLLVFDSPIAETFDELMSSLDDWASRAEGFFKGKPGAPTLRQLHRAFKEGLQRANRVRNSKEFSTVDEAKVRELLGIKEEDDIEEAIAALKKPATETPPAKDSAEDDLKTELAKTQQQVLELQKSGAVAEATRVVEEAVKEGKLLPVQKETALKMALRDGAEFKAFIETQPKMLEFGERGSSKDDGNYSRFEPNAAEISAAKSIGVWGPEHRVSMMRTKAQAEGVELPADFK